ncbi:thermonuclease family protein [Brucella cytisi]|uniref:Micrococcal nuclease n=1 Tax=Brucella cytisi TaxID=407152 RepID=A0A1J6I5L7_9HYPH|nr:thermonuclease family protein [Brucella cytisi]OIS90224.1 micrococcal nuclease [Brucella cytisi]
MRLSSLRALAVGAILLCSVPAWADFSGDVVRIIDGDTVVVLVDRQQVRVRLADIDAPESGQAFGSRSRQRLADLIFRKHVRVVEKDTDRYGRTLGIVYFKECYPVATCVELPVNAVMVSEGMAWAYRFRDRPTDPEMFAIEQNARSAGRGLWSDPHAQEPWKWRRDQKQPTN